MKEIVLQKDFCPSCGAELDGAVEVGGENTPQVGDLTVCIYCATVSTFGEAMILRVLPAGEYAQLGRAMRMHVESIRALAKEMQAKPHISKEKRV